MLSVNVKLAHDDFRLDVAFELDAPILGVFGHSGAGKTTLLHLIAGLIRPGAGRIALADHTLSDAATGTHVKTHERHMAVMFQDDRLFPHYSVRGNLLYGSARTKSNGSAPSLDRIASLLGIAPLLDRGVRDLSGGERQRVALGRALLSGPKLLLLDEPLASLDRAMKQQILPYLRRIKDELGVPMLYVSHDLTEILQLTDRLLVLRNGRVAGYGAYFDLARDEAVLDVVHESDLINVLDATVKDVDREAGLTRLRIGSCDLAAPLRPFQPDETVQVRIRPSDIAIALRPIEGLSIRNQLPGRIVSLQEHGGRVIVTADVGARLLVQISLKTVRELELEVGQDIHCLIKSNAVEYLI